MQVRHALLALAAAMALALAPRAAVAQGTAFDFECDPGFALVGLEGWQGAWMDGIRGLCSAVNLQTGAVSSIVRRTSVAGTVKSGTRTYRCPANMVMTGFGSSQANYVLSIHSISCREVKPGGMADTRITFRDAFPHRESNLVTGRGRSVMDECSGGTMATHVRGREGTYLDSFGIYCFRLPGATEQVATNTSSPSSPPRITRPGTITRPVAPARVTLVAPANGYGLVGRPPQTGCYTGIVGFPSFRWNAVDHATRYEMELRNVTQNKVKKFGSTTTSVIVTRYTRYTPAAGNTYTWRVRGVNAIGMEGPWSDVRTMVAGTAQRTAGPCTTLTPSVVW